MSTHLQVELFEFRGEDITEEEDGGIIRRIITKGEGYTKPNEGAAVEGNASINVFDTFNSMFHISILGKSSPCLNVFK